MTARSVFVPTIIVFSSFVKLGAAGRWWGFLDRTGILTLGSDGVAIPPSVGTEAVPRNVTPQRRTPLFLQISRGASPMKTLVATILGAMLLASVASVAAAAAPKHPSVSYWTVAQANTAVVALATLGYCSPTGCKNGVSVAAAPKTRYKISSSSCAGTAGFASKGRWSRFTCTVESLNDAVGGGTLQVFTAGPKLIRWKRIA